MKNTTKRNYIQPHTSAFYITSRHAILGVSDLLDTMNEKGQNTNDADNNLSKRGRGDIWDSDNQGW